MIQCSGCSRRFFFDFIWELCYRMVLHAGWYKRYLDSPARRDILERVEPALRELLEKTRVGDELVLKWSRCFTCEFEDAVRTRAVVELRDLRAVVRKLEPLPGQAAVMAIEYGVIDAPRMLLPLSRGPNADAPCKNAAFNRLRLVVTVWPSALKAELVGDELNALHSGPYGAHATSAIPTRQSRGVQHAQGGGERRCPEAPRRAGERVPIRHRAVPCRNAL